MVALEILRHGKKGELRQRYRAGMQDQLGAVGLVVNALVLRKTRCLQQALGQWQEAERVLNPDEVVHLSPLLHEHANMLNSKPSHYSKPLQRGNFAH
jgi:hypothetical protein